MIPNQLLSLTANHLWQSTPFAAVSGLLALALQSNRAQTRYWVWLAASLKFLVPFSLLVGVGSHLGVRQTATPITPVQLSVVIERASQPFIAPAQPNPVELVARRSPANWIPAVLFAFWGTGSATILFFWWRRWRGLRAAVRTAAPLDVHIGIRAVVSSAFAEPGVFGVRKPVLLLPTGITDRLTPSQFQAVLAHELCHVRRRDNLTAALHMGVEALFWFHPLVWWLGGRLMEERERACDEQVLRMGNAPEEYAEGILKICELYMESPLPCVSGVTGANLRRRIEAIMSGRAALGLSAAKKALLAAAGAAAVAMPVLLGALHTPAIEAQPAAVSARFEVASIKACKGGDTGPVGRGSGGRGGGEGDIWWDAERLHEECQTLNDLIRQAYVAFPDGKEWPVLWRVQNSADAGDGPPSGSAPPMSMRRLLQEIEGTPGWVNSDRYTIDAKAEHPASSEMLRGPMMQALLEDRFHLKIRREPRDRPVYELIVADGGLRLQPSTEGSCITMSESMKLRPEERARSIGSVCGLVTLRDGKANFPGTTMAGFARNISGFLDRDVIDKTGVAGFYDLHLDVRPVLPAADDSQPSDDGAPPPPPQPGRGGPGSGMDGAAMAKEFQRALPKVGLKLEPSKGSAVTLVIEHVEKPTEN